MPSIRPGSRDQEMSSLRLKGIRQYPTLIASNATRARTHHNNLHQIQMIVVIPDAKKVTTVLYRFETVHTVLAVLQLRLGPFVRIEVTAFFKR